jgi:thioredoxin 1
MKATELTSENFDSTLAGTDLPVLVDFHAEWCGPCKMLGPIVEQIAESKAGEALVAKVDIDAARDIAMRYKITSVPTLIVFKGGVPIEATRGVQTKAALEAMIDRAAAAETAAN